MEKDEKNGMCKKEVKKEFERKKLNKVNLCIKKWGIKKKRIVLDIEERR